MKLQNKPDETKRTPQVVLFLSLTAIMSAQLVSAANGTGLGGPPRPSESFRAIELSSCKLPGVPQPARCGVLEVPENPTRLMGRRLRIGGPVLPPTGASRR